MKPATLLFFSLILSSCYKTLTLENFNKNEWTSYKKECSEYRLNSVDLIMKNRDLILESTQNEIESLLGAADEHELYSRSQKFFHYRLSQPDTCKNFESPTRFLTIRFNAIGRANDVQITLRK